MPHSVIITTVFSLVLNRSLEENCMCDETMNVALGKRVIPRKNGEPNEAGIARIVEGGKLGASRGRKNNDDTLIGGEVTPNVWMLHAIIYL